MVVGQGGSYYHMGINVREQPCSQLSLASFTSYVLIWQVTPPSTPSDFDSSGHEKRSHNHESPHNHDSLHSPVRANMINSMPLVSVGVIQSPPALLPAHYSTVVKVKVLIVIKCCVIQLVIQRFVCNHTYSISALCISHILHQCLVYIILTTSVPCLYHAYNISALFISPILHQCLVYIMLTTSVPCIYHTYYSHVTERLSV